MNEQNEDGNDLEFDFENGDYYQGKFFQMRLLLMFGLESESSERENTSDSLSFGSFDYLERSISRYSDERHLKNEEFSLNSLDYAFEL